MSNKFEEFLASSGLEMKILEGWTWPKGDQYKVELRYKTRKWVGYIWHPTGKKLTLRDAMATRLWFANSGMVESLKAYRQEYEEEETLAQAKKRYASAVETYKEMSTLLGADYDTFLYMWFEHN